MFIFFNRKISWYVDNFNSIKERTKHVLVRIRGANENALTKIKLKIEIIVSELVGLFWV